MDTDLREQIRPSGRRDRSRTLQRTTPPRLALFALIACGIRPPPAAPAAIEGEWSVTATVSTAPGTDEREPPRFEEEYEEGTVTVRIKYGMMIWIFDPPREIGELITVKSMEMSYVKDEEQKRSARCSGDVPGRGVRVHRRGNATPPSQRRRVGYSSGEGNGGAPVDAAAVSQLPLEVAAGPSIASYRDSAEHPIASEQPPAARWTTRNGRWRPWRRPPSAPTPRTGTLGALGPTTTARWDCATRR